MGQHPQPHTFLATPAPDVGGPARGGRRSLPLARHRATLGCRAEGEQVLNLGANKARLDAFDLEELDVVEQRFGIPVPGLAERYDSPALAHTQVDRPGAMSDHV